MADTYNGNDIHLVRGGVDIAGLFREVTYDFTIAEVDTSAGSGIDYMTSAGGLITGALSGTITFPNDATIRGNVLPIMQQGSEETTTFGPMGDTAGLPKFEAEMLSLGGASTVSHDKQLVTIPFTFKLADQPVDEINRGDTF